MQLKRSMELTPYDLPRIESPFLAAAEVGWLISSGRLSRADLTALLRVRPDCREPLQLLATRQVADGDLFLIHGPFDPGPLSPVIDWRDNPELKAGGEWKPSSPLPFDLGYALQELNRRQLTPDDVKRGPIPGASGTATERTRTSDQNPERTATTATSASVMATTLAGIKLASESGQVPEKEQEPEIHVEVGIFTDGTLNNAFNSQLLADKLKAECLKANQFDAIEIAECKRQLGLMMGGSYRNSASNVFKLWGMYPDIDATNGNIRKLKIKAYIEGVGTKTGSGDSMMGAATGIGETGIKEQVLKSFDEIARQIENRLQGQAVSSFTFDVFGFSRGAAAARYAINEINVKDEGLLGKALQARGQSWPRKHEIRFVGLFDTVAAVLNIANGDLSAANNKNQPVELFLDPTQISTAVQLTAANEHRKLFALNSLKSPDDELPSNFREIELPGAHSDIGGGYPDHLREEVLITPLHQVDRDRFSWPEKTIQWDYLDSLKSGIASEQWIGEYSLPVPKSPVLNPRPREINAPGEPQLEIFIKRSEHPAPDGNVELALRMCRTVKGEYSRVALSIMHKMANDAGVGLESPPERRETRVPEELLPILESLEKQIEAGVNTPELDPSQRKLLFQRYIHYSANYNTVNTSILGIPLSLRILRNFNTNMPAKSRKRIVHFNTENH